MIRLSPISQPTWLPLSHDVEVLVLPMSSVIMARAAEAVAGVGEGDSASVQTSALTDAVARVAITDWRGVGDLDGNPLAISPEAISALIAMPAMRAAFFDGYVKKALAVVAEKKGSAPSPNGTSAGAPITAAPARGSAKTVRRNSTKPKATKAP